MSQTLYLPYLEPWNWSQFYQHFAMRLLPGVEALSANSYSRSVHVGQLRGWLSVAPLADRPALALTLSDTLQPVQSAIAARVRRMFDLDADPVAIAAHLCQDAKLAPGVLANPGLRVPAAYDPFEQAVRAIVGALKTGGTLVYYITVWQPLPVRLGSEKQVSKETVSDACNRRQIKEYPVLKPDLTDPHMQNIAVLAVIDQESLIPGIKTGHFITAMEDLMAGDMLAGNRRLFQDRKGLTAGP